MFVMQAGENATLTCIVRQVGSKLVSFNQKIITNSNVFPFTFQTKNLQLNTFPKNVLRKTECHFVSQHFFDWNFLSGSSKKDERDLANKD
jgi:hypothetical protein